MQRSLPSRIKLPDIAFANITLLGYKEHGIVTPLPLLNLKLMYGIIDETAQQMLKSGCKHETSGNEYMVKKLCTILLYRK